jgi:hypothetical protein
MNPTTEAESSREGMEYVALKMNWYLSLSKLLDRNVKDKHHQNCIVELGKAIIQLYTKLLLYQMKSVCYQQRQNHTRRIRGLVKLDGWEGQLNDIKDAEKVLQYDMNQYATLDMQQEIGSIARAVDSQIEQLNGIRLDLDKHHKHQQTIQKSKENKEDEQCLKDLFVTDPELDKKRIEKTKGGLLNDSYRWILKNETFQSWQEDQNSQLLWVKGDPGKGKTMLLCGIINELELQNQKARNKSVSYFFCQQTLGHINSATSVLRGLLYSLLKQQKSLIKHLRKKYDTIGSSLFKDTNAWFALAEIFSDVLKDPNLESTYILIDALDECSTSRSELLKFVAEHSALRSCVKWIVSSRNWRDIEIELEQAGHKVNLTLELNADSVSAAVSVFIDHKVSKLAKKQDYDKRTRDKIFNHLTKNAHNTFLWVALVCQNLEDTEERNVQGKLDSSPPGLQELYARMLEKVISLASKEEIERCKRVLAVMTIVYRPISSKELVALVESLRDLKEKDVLEIIAHCGSFLTLRDNTVYFVHQSANDFLLSDARDQLFPDSIQAVHQEIFSRSLAILSKTLRKDMYKLKELGISIDDAEARAPEQHPLAASRYSCIYWIDHLYDSKREGKAGLCDNLQSADLLEEFIREKYLYWLEGLSLCKSLAKGATSIGTLRSMLQVCLGI